MAALNRTDKPPGGLPFGRGAPAPLGVAPETARDSAGALPLQPICPWHQRKIDMNEKDLRGFLIVIEGVDGTGKSTLLRRLQADCEARGLGCVVSREPTNGVWGTRLRDSARTGRLPLEQELELFLLDRKEHVSGLIRPALKKGSVVLLDRYYISSAAYQGARGADPEEVLRRNEEFAPEPDLVFLLDCDPEQTLQRVRARGDAADEFEKLDALRRARELFLSIKRPYIRVIDASVGADEVAGRALAILETLLSNREKGL